MVMSYIFTGILLLSIIFAAVTGRGSLLAAAVPQGAQAGVTLVQYFYAFIFAQSPDYLLQICAILIVYDFPPVLRYEHYVVLTNPFSMG